MHPSASVTIVRLVLRFLEQTHAGAVNLSGAFIACLFTDYVTEHHPSAKLYSLVEIMALVHSGPVDGPHERTCYIT